MIFENKLVSNTDKDITYLVKHYEESNKSNE